MIYGIVSYKKKILLSSNNIGLRPLHIQQSEEFCCGDVKCVIEIKAYRYIVQSQ